MSDVERLQRGLEQSLQRAGQSGDRELADRMRDEGHRLVFLLNGLLRSSRMYGPDNAAFEQPAADLAAVLAGLMELLGAVHLVLVEDQVYVNDVRLRVMPSEQAVVDHLVTELSRHDVGGLSFHRPLDTAAVKALVLALAAPAPAERARAALAARLASGPDVELAGRFRFRVGAEPERARRDYFEAARRGAAAAREALANLAAQRLPNPLPVRRAVIDLVEGLKEDPRRGMTGPLRRRGLAEAESHVLAVCELSVLLGQALGLSDAALSDLGVAAMLHDVGYTRTADRGGHTGAGALLLLRQRGFHEAKVRRLLVALEHHLPFEGGDPRPGLFARIVHIADDYERLIHGAGRPASPTRALASMWAARGRLYDPHLLALFVQVLGGYPPGTLVELSDGRWAVSVSGGRDHARFGWPVVRIVRAADGTPRDASEELDLSLVRDRLRPKRLLDAGAHGVDLEPLLAAAVGEPAA